MISQTTQDQTWSQWEFEQVDLGDKRLNTRLKKLAEDLSEAIYKENLKSKMLQAI